LKHFFFFLIRLKVSLGKRKKKECGGKVFLGQAAKFICAGILGLRLANVFGVCLLDFFLLRKAPS
jgi:hypothetical protein